MPATPINISVGLGRGSRDGRQFDAGDAEFTTTTLTGVVQDGVVVFDPLMQRRRAEAVEHLLLLQLHARLPVHAGFDEAAGNFQQTNFTHTGSERDPVRARAHSGPVQGTANMATGPDGLPPVMNMGLVASTGRHTAFDADVVFHEYTHGLTNRSVMGGRLNAPHSLDALQSGGMGEGWSDFYALTVQNFFRPVEKTVTGDWVINDPAASAAPPTTMRFHSSTAISAILRKCTTSARSGARRS
jgi:extracellular elastinolytic metalloproteinase